MSRDASQITHGSAADGASEATPAARPLRVLAITRKPDSASFEQRVTHYLPHLAKLGIEVTCQTLPRSFTKQWKLISDAACADSAASGASGASGGGGYDVIWWHRHLLGLAMRWRLKRTGIPVVFDFDDPLPFSSETNTRSASRSRRFAGMLSLSRACLPASEYLRDLARPFCEEAVILPMAIDLPPRNPPEAPPEGSLESSSASETDVAELLWLGGKSTQGYLQAIAQPLDEVAQARPGRVKLRLVAHEPMSFGAMEVDFRRWSFEEQAMALAECDIGLCPMPSTPWTMGKCPFKVLQYMAWQMPWVGSQVGANIISAGEPGSASARGLCAGTSDQWREHLLKLIDSPAMRHSMGQAGGAYALENHDRARLALRLADVLRRAASK